MSENELKPCPFCGGAVEFEYNDWDPDTETGDDGMGVIECKRCSVRMEEDHDFAVKTWNTRPGEKDGLESV